MSRDLGEIRMPAGEAEAVRSACRAARRIVEYGAGGSTIFVARECDAALLSIESDPDWRDRVAAELAALAPGRQDVTLRHVDIGPVGAWGVPAGPAAFRKFASYPLSPWVDPVFGPPDLVLIDGRFRLGCFAATLLNATAPLTLLWDDFGDRPGYHAALSLVEPEAMIGRLARFRITPRTLTPAEISRVVPWFVIPA